MQMGDLALPPKKKKLKMSPCLMCEALTGFSE